MYSATAIADRPAVKEGLFLGSLLGLLLVILRGLETLAPGGTLASLLTLALVIITYLLAGLRTAQQTGSAQTGAYAGLLAALVSSLLSLSASFLLLIARPDTLNGLLNGINQLFRQMGSTAQLPLSVLIGALVIGYLMVLCLSLLVGFAVGALGGSIGRERRMAL